VEDGEIWARLEKDEFRGPFWERVASLLVGYGSPVLHTWINDGTIGARCARANARGSVGSEQFRSMPAEDVEEIVQDVLAHGVAQLGRKRGWRPDGGQSLRSYFVTGCLQAFPTVFRSYSRSRQRWTRQAAAEGTVQSRLFGGEVDPAEGVAGDDELTRLLADIGEPDLRTALYMSFYGFSNAEIASTLGDGVTRRAVEEMLRRYRRARPVHQGGNGRHA
jgi:DNA-directed RNA polymerase specialized sigma24 family protein